MKTMADVAASTATENKFSEAFKKKVLGSIRRMARLRQYGVPLEQIPADLEAFDKRWGRGPVRSLEPGFRSKKDFSDWRSQTRSALTAFIGTPKVPRESAPEDDWAHLRRDLKGKGVVEKKLICVDVLSSAARKAALTPETVSGEWLQDMIDGADTAGRYRAIKAACKLIGEHESGITVPTSPEIRIPRKKSRGHCVRLDLHSPLREQVGGWKRRRIEGEPKGHLRRRFRGASVAHTEQAVQGITYVYTAAVHSGLIEYGAPCSVEDLANHDLLADIIESELIGDFPWRSLARTTLFEYLNSFRLFVRGCDLDIAPLTGVIRDFEEFENIKAMSAPRREWCEDFLRDRRKHAVFLGLPNTLFRQARKAMESYENVSILEKRAAVALGIAACAAAIWTSLPLRASTLLKLSFGFENADVQIHNKRKSLTVTTSRSIVKNGFEHHAVPLIRKPGGDPREIVEWFTRDVRPRLLENHVAAHLRDTTKLFGGVSYARLNSIWSDVSLSAGVPMTPHQVRHAIATLMANEPNADYALIAALLGDTEATVRKNYVFIDQGRKQTEGQNVLAQLHGRILKKGGL
jgi:integrase